MISSTRGIRVFEIAEWRSAVVEGIELCEEDRRLVEELRRKGKHLFVDELRNGLRVSTQSWVGVVRFSNLEIQIVPKLAGEHIGLVELLDYVSGLDSLKRYRSVRNLADQGASLFDLVALLFAEACEELIRGGLLADYREREGDLPVIRGRFLPERQMLRRFGLLDKLECRYDEQVLDIPENQILAATTMATMPRVTNAAVKSRHSRLRSVLTSICSASEVNLGRTQRDIVYDRKNERYRDAHALAWMLLNGLGIDDLYRSGGPRCFAFLLDANRLFERFVERWLGQLLNGTPYKPSFQQVDPTVIWNAGLNEPYQRIKPDVIVTRGDVPGRHLAIDAKYKLYDERRIDPGDVYQSFLYAYAHADEVAGAPNALLIYPSSRPEGGACLLNVRTHGGRIGARIAALGVHVPSALREAKAGAVGPVSTHMLDAIEQRLEMIPLSLS